MWTKPSNEEFPAYFGKYIDLVSEGSLEDTLIKQLKDTTAFLSNISETQGNYRYAIDKWTLKEVIGHITDTERIMSYRLLRIARGDQSPLAGYDDEQYVKEATFHSRSFPDLLKDFSAVRQSTVSLVRSLPEDVWSRKGIANNSEISVRGLAYIIAGHELHHVEIIKDKYVV
ncbi:DinB family protein [Paenisporosarcina macmurdoensis]|uniref:DinB family protein n=1 Tax=Paenisporosarcina macmurdoensis TaxID=212659 RepID=A0ABW1L8F8_9BACL